MIIVVCQVYVDIYSRNFTNIVENQYGASLSVGLLGPADFPLDWRGVQYTVCSTR